MTLLTPGLGSAHSTLVLANNPAIVGAAFFQQTIPLELDASLAITEIRSSNALSMVVGVF